MIADALVDRAIGLLGAGRRTLLGIVGAPGAGKSTIAGDLVAAARARGVVAQAVPMDGFHLADVTLERLGLRDRKGAPETFDPYGYAALLRRLRDERDHTVYAPGFERDLDQPIAGAVGVEPDVELVVTEGNYLLLDRDGWALVPPLLDETWFCAIDDDVRRSRLHARHVEVGRTPDEATAWMATVDEPNAVLVNATIDRADLVVDLTPPTTD